MRPESLAPASWMTGTSSTLAASRRSWYSVKLEH